MHRLATEDLVLIKQFFVFLLPGDGCQELEELGFYIVDARCGFQVQFHPLTPLVGIPPPPTVGESACGLCRCEQIGRRPCGD